MIKFAKYKKTDEYLMMAKITEENLLELSKLTVFDIKNSGGELQLREFGGWYSGNIGDFLFRVPEEDVEAYRKNYHFMSANEVKPLEGNDPAWELVEGEADGLFQKYVRRNKTVVAHRVSIDTVEDYEATLLEFQARGMVSPRRPSARDRGDLQRSVMPYGPITHHGNAYHGDYIIMDNWSPKWNHRGDNYTIVDKDTFEANYELIEDDHQFD